MLLLAYLAIVVMAMRRIAPPWAALFAVLVACQTVAFEYVFRIGRIDHHALQVVLVTASAVLFAFHGRVRRAPELSGIFCALSLAVGLETLPFVALIGVANVLAWVFDDSATREMVRFSAAFAAASLFAFGLQTAPSLWMKPTCDTLSVPWLFLAVGSAFLAATLSRVTRSLATPQRRLIAAGAGGAIVIAIFAIAFPRCLAGPYEIVPEPYRSIWLGDILEARPGWLRLALGSDAVTRAFGPLVLAAAAASFLAFRSTGALRRWMAISAGSLFVGIAISLVQVRGLYIVSAFVPPVAAVAVWRIVETLRERQSPPLHAAIAALTAFAFLAPVWSAPALAVRALVPARETAVHPASDCLLKSSVSALDGLPPGLVLAPIDLGAYTLLYTHHSIIAGGFHRAVEGIVAGIDAFKGSEADMRRVVRRHAPDYLVVCPDWARTEAAEPAPFAKQLSEGAVAPWLERVPLDAGPLMVWRVRREALSQD